MKKFLLVQLMLLSALCGLWAQNLVSNPSFENGPSMYCGVFTGTDFDASVDLWYTPSFGTPDLFSTTINPACWNFQLNSTYAGPIGLKGMQLPRTGDVMAGFFARTVFGMDKREYVQVPLTEPLEAQCFYRVSFWVSLADSTELASNNIGAALSTSPTMTGNDSVMPLFPQVRAGTVIASKDNWVQIVDTIQASGVFRYLTIGNFFGDDATDTLPNPSYSGKPGTYGAYYFLDDVSVHKVCPEVDLGGNQQVCLGDTLVLDGQLQGACYANATYLWTTGETTATIEVMDQGFYGVQVTVDTCVIGDTIFVDLDFCPPTVDMANVFSPNGDGMNDVFRPVTFTRVKNVTLQVYDRWGKKMFETRDLNQGWDGTWKGKPAPEGVYYWALVYRGRNQEFDRRTGPVTLMR